MGTTPTTSAEILAAQAASGMDGVAAYEAAQARLKDQKQTAVGQALSEAMSRGAPAGAMPTGGIAGQYDDRIASLTEGQASYQDDASSRDRRMADYNASISSARSLIGDEAARSVAPINAQADYQIRASETQRFGWRWRWRWWWRFADEGQGARQGRTTRVAQ
jgi:hypothetical protein